MREKFVEKRGALEGPTSIILAGVHGNETCGVVTLEKTLPVLEIKRGRVFFGYGNPMAIEKNTRFVEADLNRLFWEDNSLSGKDRATYEYKRSREIKTYLDKSDALLDLHGSSIQASPAFAICEANSRDILKFLPVNLVVSGFDDVEFGGTDAYMNKLGKIGICFECGYLDGPVAIKLGEKAIFAFLQARGHIDGEPKKTQGQNYIRVYEKYFTKTDRFRLEKSFENFEELKMGQIIGIDGSEEIRALKESVIIFAHNKNKAGSEAFLLGEKKRNL